MFKAARIIYLIGGILNIISTIPLAIFGFLFIVAGIAVANGQYTDPLPDGYTAQTFETAAYLFGAFFLVLAFLWVVGAVIAFIARAQVGNTKGIHIFILIIGVLSMDPLLIVPGILSLATYGKVPAAR